MTGRALIDAVVLPMDDPGRTGTGVLWEDGKVVLVGDDAQVTAEAEHRGIRPERLGGRLVLPGFVDAHMHFLQVGLKDLRPDLHGATSLDDALARVAAWIEAHPGDGPVTAEGWDESLWGDPRRPHRDDLDRLAPDRPVVMRRVCGHVAVANGAALQVIGDRWSEPGQVDAPTGLLLEEPSLYLSEALPPTDAELDAAVDAACRAAHRLGVTSLGDYAQAPHRRALARAAAEGRLTVRVAASLYPQDLEAELERGFRTGRPHGTPQGPSPWLRDGGLKVFLDGSIGGRTALLREPYADEPSGRGCRLWSDEALDRLLRRASEAGVQIHAHAIGDGAVDQGLDAFTRLAVRRTGLHGSREETQEDPLRHRFEHFEIVHDGQVQRAARLRLAACVQPNFVGAWSGPGGLYEKRLGSRCSLNNRFVSCLRAGIRLSFGSDGMPFSPLVGLQAALDHPIPSERLGAHEALWLYTRAAAWSLHWEGEIGSLEPGKHADLVVLEADLARPPRTWRILETVQAGSTVWRQDDR